MAASATATPSAKVSRPVNRLIEVAVGRKDQTVGRARARERAASAARLATSRPAAPSIQKWLAVTTTTQKTSTGYAAQRILVTLCRAMRTPVTPIIVEKATCMEGIAA